MEFSKGALGMLLKRYRKILHKCHLLNLLGGLVLAGTLASPVMAPAADWGADPVIINSFESISSAQAVDNLRVEDGGRLNVEISAGGDISQYLTIQKKLDLSAGGVINITGGMGIQGGPYPEAGTGGGDPYSGEFQISGGTVNINSSDLSMAAGSITGGTINISGKKSPITDTWLGTFSRLEAQNENGSLSVSGTDTQINLGDYGLLAGASKFSLSEATLNMAGTTLDSAALLRGRGEDNSMVNLANARLNIAADKFGVMMGRTFQFDNSDINIEGSLVLSGFIPSDEDGTLSELFSSGYSGGPQGLAFMNGGKLNVSGTLELNRRMGLELAKNAVINNGGTIVARYDSSLHIANAKFTAQPGSRLIAFWDGNRGQGVIQLGENQLGEALKGGIDLQGGVLNVMGSASIAGEGSITSQAEDGKIAITGQNSIFRADNLTVHGNAIALPNSGTISADILNLDQQVATSGMINITGNSTDSRLNIGDGTGTLTLEEGGSLQIKNLIGLGTDGITEHTEINGNVIADHGYIKAEARTTDQGLSDVSVNLNGSMVLVNSALELKDAILTMNEPSTVFKADANSRIDNGGEIVAATSALGLNRNGDEWSSANLQTTIGGVGMLRLTGVGASVSTESFKNLRELLGSSMLSIDAPIDGAVTDGKIALANVSRGGPLAGVILEDVIAEGAGNAGNKNMPLGAFAGVNITDPQATGITVTGYSNRLMLAGNGGNLIDTPNGPGNALVNRSASLSLKDGNVANVELDSGTADLNNVNAANIHLSMTAESGTPLLMAYGNVSANQLTVSCLDPVGKADVEVAGEVRVSENAHFNIKGDIGDSTHLVNEIFSGGDISANSIYANNFTAANGSVTANEDIHVHNSFNVSGSVLKNGANLETSDLAIDNSSANVGGSIVINNNASIKNSSLTSENSSLTISGATVLSGDSSVSAATGINLGKDFNVLEGKVNVVTTNGDINAAGADIFVAGGSELRMAANNGIVHANNIGATQINAGTLRATGNLAMNAGELKLVKASEVNGNVILENTAANVGDLAVGKKLLVDGGEFNSSGTLALKDEALIGNGANASANVITLADGKSLTVGQETDLAGGATLSVNVLNLNGGDLLVDPAWGQPASNVAVASFNTVAQAKDAIINGNVVVGQNSYLTIGSKDTGWLPGVVTGPMELAGLSENGPSAALGIFKPVTLGAGHSLTVDGTWQSGQNYNRDNGLITFADKSLLVINGKPKGSSISYSGDARSADVTAAISAEVPTTAYIDAGARLYITDAEADKTYVVLDDSTITPNYGNDTTAWAGNNIGSDNPLLIMERADLIGGNPGEVRARSNSAAAVMPGLDSELVNAIDAAALEGQIGVAAKYTNQGSRGTQFLSRALVMASPAYGNDAAKAAKTIESAARIAVLGGAPQMTLAANNAAGAAVTQRTSLANPGSSIQAMDSEGNVASNSMNRHGVALWILPLYQSSNGFGMEAGNYDYDFSGALGGVAIGADYTFNDILRAGILFNIGGGYNRGSGEFNTTTNNMSFWGIGAYAGFGMDNFGLIADVNFTSTFNKIRQDIYGMVDMSELKLDADAWAISTGLRAEYKLVTDYLDIIPHAGFRYINLNVNSYDVKSRGTVIDGDSITQNIWTFPVGITLSKDIAMANGWTFKPLLDINVTPAAGDIKAKGNIRFTGTSTEAELQTKMMDYITYGGTAGVEFGNGDFTLGVNYTGQFGAESSAHGIFGTLRYEF